MRSREEITDEAIRLVKSYLGDFILGKVFVKRIKELRRELLSAPKEDTV